MLRGSSGPNTIAASGAYLDPRGSAEPYKIRAGRPRQRMARAAAGAAPKRSRALPTTSPPLRPAPLGKPPQFLHRRIQQRHNKSPTAATPQDHRLWRCRPMPFAASSGSGTPALLIRPQQPRLRTWLTGRRPRIGGIAAASRTRTRLADHALDNPVRCDTQCDSPSAYAHKLLPAHH